MLKITITCRCGSRYDINESCNNQGYISCPNCKRDVDSKNAIAITHFISGAKAVAGSDSVKSLSVEFRSE